MKTHSILMIFLVSLWLPCLSYGQAATKSTAAEMISAARKQIGVTTSYDPAYVPLDYPKGDVPQDRGVCTDVVIRAMRAAAIDLQELVHIDMKKNFSAYPKTWGLRSTDANIDHRRVPNLMTFFQRRGFSLAVTKNAEDYQAGDLITCLVAGKLPHIMIVSDKKGASGNRLVIHNIGQGTQEEDRLLEFPITGHYRWK
jgi:uncharacterized protein